MFLLFGWVYLKPAALLLADELECMGDLGWPGSLQLTVAPFQQLLIFREEAMTASASNNSYIFLQNKRIFNKTSQELGMLSSATLDCQVTKIDMNSCCQNCNH